FDVTLPALVAAGRVITATATGPGGNTSEFAEAVEVISGGIPVLGPSPTVLEDSAPLLVDVRGSPLGVRGLSVASVAGDLAQGGGLTYSRQGDLLTLTFAPDANGSAIVTLVGTAPDGSAAQKLFFVTVSPVNDAPRFAGG